MDNTTLHSSVDGLLGCFHFVAAVTVTYRLLCDYMLFPLGFSWYTDDAQPAEPHWPGDRLLVESLQSVWFEFQVYSTYTIAGKEPEVPIPFNPRNEHELLGYINNYINNQDNHNNEHSQVFPLCQVWGFISFIS